MGEPKAKVVAEMSVLNDMDQTKAVNMSVEISENTASNGIEPKKNSADVQALEGSIPLSEMESSLESTNFPIDEIPEPIKVLDDIISEFEEASKPVIITNAENQSEDDGYMSLSRKNMRKHDSEDTSLTSLNRASVETSNQDFEIKTNGTICSSNEIMTNNLEERSTDPILIQTTLPKARVGSTNLIQTNYSSLPCCGVRSSNFLGEEISGKQTRFGSCNGDRNVLGIDISAVHKAVLRGGVAKLPEPIVNEHPVTIYPGRFSPPSGDNSRGASGGNRPQRLNSAKENRQRLKPLSSKSSSSSSSPRSTSESLALKSMDILDLSSKNCIPKNRACKTEHKLNYEESDDDDDENEDDDIEDFSEDSVDGEQLSMSADLTDKPIMTRKHDGIAWEIHFNSERMGNPKPQAWASDCLLKQQNASSNSIPQNFKERPFGFAYSNAIYSLDPEEEFPHNIYAQKDCKNEDSLDYYAKYSNMIGKGTYVIRRNTNSNKLTKAADFFQKSTENDRGYEPIVHQENCKVDETKFQYNSSVDCSLTQRTFLPGPRERLSLDIEVHDSQRSSSKDEKYSKSKRASVKTASEDIIVSHKLNKKHANRKNSIELKKKQDNTHNECNIISNFSGYNCLNGSNSLKSEDFLSGQSLDLQPTSNPVTPHRDLAPTIEEDEECSDLSYSGVVAPSASEPISKRVENNISALSRVEIIRGNSFAPLKRPLEFRPGVHKSESAKEMLLSQSTVFGPLPPSPPLTSSCANEHLFDYNALPLPPLPSSPAPVSSEGDDDELFITKAPYLIRTTSVEVHAAHNDVDNEKRCIGRDRSIDRRDKDWDREKIKKRFTKRQMSDDLPLPPTAISFEHMPPAVPPHRGHSANTMKSWSIDSNYKRKSPKVVGGSMGYYGFGSGSGMTTPTGTHHAAPSNDLLGIVGGCHSSKRYVSHGTKRSSKQSPREEHRGSLQTSCSLPETPIFARGCDVPRTPFRRTENPAGSGSRTAPRSTTSHNINMGATIGGFGGNTCGGISSICRQRSISHALASNEMLRMSGVPQRGWYPKQRSMRPSSTENIDRLNSMRIWDGAATNIGTGGTGSRKPLTLPPNLTPSFLNKSPREALRRVTSLLITKKKTGKERKSKPYYEDMNGDMPYDTDTSKQKSSFKKDVHDSSHNSSALPKPPKPPKKRNLFKNLWKRTKHLSIDQ